jgi:quinolinate synthase
VGVLYPLKQNDPDKEFYFVSPTPVCYDMKLNTLEKIANVLESEKNQITLSEEQINKALLPLERMLELAK